MRSFVRGGAAFAAVCLLAAWLVPKTANAGMTKVAEIGPFSSISDADMVSPKSVLFHPTLPKFYVNALEAGKTLVYETGTLKKLRVISHTVMPGGPRHAQGTFGKPVEGWFSHGGRYLWVTYYRWTDDPTAMRGSGFAQIDTSTDEIVKVYPTGNIPKFITADVASQRLAVTLWGENKVEVYDIADPAAIRLIGTVRVGPEVHAQPGSDRDRTCGMCLRGTAFIPGTAYLVVARMGGGGLALVDVDKLQVVKMLSGLPATPRHLQVYKGHLYMTANVSGSVARVELDNLIAHSLYGEPLRVQSRKIGAGARTLKVAGDKLYVALNESKQIARANLDLSGVEYAPAPAFPVGLDVSARGDSVIVTSQGHAGVGGHRVSVYSIDGFLPASVR